MRKTMKTKVTKRILYLGLVCASLFLIPINATAEENTIQAPASFADLAERLSPAVVNISSTQKTAAAEDMPEMPQFPPGSPFQDFFDEFMSRRGQGMPLTPTSSLGSGFIIDAQNGYIITNNHVIRDADEIRVTFSNNETVPAEIVGKDEKVDIAVLKVKPKSKLTAVPFGDSDVMRVGDWIVAIGNPFGLGGTVTTGIISARQRDINSGPYDDYLQTDASINRGNSGGPMFNLKGEVIGINTAIFSPSGGSVGIGFAVPSSLAKPVINQIIQYGRTRRGWLGVRIQTVTDEIAESLGLDSARGALVASINKDGPADVVGIQPGDIILKFNNQDIKEMRFLPRYVAEADINSVADVEYWRDGKILSAKVKVGELEQAEEDGMLAETQQVAPGTGVSVDSVGLEIQPMNEALRTMYNIAPSVKGVVVTVVKDLSEAAEKGLLPGDVIVEINQQPVTEPSQVTDIIESAKAAKRGSVLLLLNHEGEVRFVPLKLPESKE